MRFLSDPNLTQTYTHDSADTDVAVASLHHTIGAGPFNAAAGDHKYHSFANGQYFFDDYSQTKNFRLFTENATFTNTRFCPISSVEYWDGAAWVAWVGGDVFIKTLLDGQQNTASSIDHTHRRFRFIITKNSGWPSLGLVMLQSQWTPVAYTSITVRIEDCSTIGGTYVLKDTCVFGAGTTSAGWGVHVKATNLLHSGFLYNRVEIDINDWVDSGAYLTAPLNGFEIFSNYQGLSKDPWSWDYDKKVTFPGAIVSGVQPVVLNNDTRLVVGTIAAGTDLNTMIITGKFQQPSNVNATLLLNYPLANAAGLLEVATGYHYQRYTTYMQNGDRTFVRGYYGGTWNAWNELAKVGHSQSADTITDGTTNKAYTTLDHDKLAGISGTNTGDQDLSAKAPLASPAFTGTPTGITATHVGLDQVDNVADIDKIVSQLQGAAITLRSVKTMNLSDLSDIGVARTNLGLGSSAVKDVGTIAGKVAAGDDIRFENGMISTIVEGIVADVVDANDASVSTGDKLAALQAAANKARDQNKTLFIGPGDYRIQGTLVIQSSVYAPGARLWELNGGDVAVQLGVPGTTIQHEEIHLPRIFCDYSVDWTTVSGIGIEVRDMDACNVWIPYVTGFTTALNLNGYGTEGTYNPPGTPPVRAIPSVGWIDAGISYNTFNIGQMSSKVSNLVINGWFPGWVTQNTFIGGRWSIGDSTDGIRQTGTVQVRIGMGAGGGNGMGIGNCGQQVFLGCSFEGRVPEYIIDCWDQDNLFLNCRYESNNLGGFVRYLDNGGGPANCGATGNVIIGGREAELLTITESAKSHGNTLIAHSIGASDGTYLLPGMAFQNDPDTGTWREAANNMSLVAGGQQMLRVTTDDSAMMYRGVIRAQANSRGFQLTSSSANVPGGSLVMPLGTVAPTVPDDGAMWMMANGMFFHANGVLHCLDDTGWQTATLLTGWTVYGGFIPKFRRLNGVTYMQGQASSTGAGSVAFVLPAGYRPLVQMQVVAANASGVGVPCLLPTAGNVGQNTAAVVGGFSFSSIPPFPCIA